MEKQNLKYYPIHKLPKIKLIKQNNTEKGKKILKINTKIINK